MLVRIAGVSVALLVTSVAHAGVSSVDLGNYTQTATYNLPGVLAAEASAVTWNWDSNTLFVLGDEGHAIVQVSKTGQLIDSMSLTGFLDTEGMTYIGNGNFVITEERRQQAFLVSYSGGGSVNKTALQMAQLGPQLGDGGGGNVGVEGISYDPRNGTFVFVKEKTPEQANQASINFPAGTATTSTLFDPASLGLSDLSDIQVLSTVTSGPDAGNLLIMSQESRRLLEVDRSGHVLSMFNLPLVGDGEGVTIDGDGNIYVTSEIPQLLVLTPNPAPVPLPAAAWMLLSGLGVIATRVRKSRARAG